jgi:hypothetical protein
MWIRLRDVSRALAKILVATVLKLNATWAGSWQGGGNSSSWQQSVTFLCISSQSQVTGHVHLLLDLRFLLPFVRWSMNSCILIQLRKQPTRCKYIDLIFIPSQLYMFRAKFSPIIGSAWLYLQHLVVFTQVAAGWCHAFQLIHYTSWQRLEWILPDTVNTVKCSWWLAKTSPETYRAG